MRFAEPELPDVVYIEQLTSALYLDGREDVTVRRVPGGPEELDAAATGIDTTVPHSARIWNYWLGGKDNFAVDRAVAAKRLELIPDGGQGARISRGFLARGVAHMARAGITQFLDIGSGLPTAQNTHQIAQAVAPGARVVYVDHDPIVLAHARALLTSTREGATAYIHADLGEPNKIHGKGRQDAGFRASHRADPQQH